MELWIALVIFAVALTLVIKAADIFLDSAIWVARTFHIPDLIIGATLVSLCTTLPETIVSVNSSISGLDGMAFGNAMGSILFNGCVILAAVFLVMPPRLKDRGALAENLFTMAGALALVMGSVLLFGEIARICGVLLLLSLTVFLYRNVKRARRGDETVEILDHGKPRGGLPRNLLFLALGAGGTVLGSRMMVEYGSLIASRLGVSDMIIGLTMTAVGSSLPELITAISSMRKNAPDISVGNIIGANMLNVLIVIGASAVLNPLAIDPLSACFHLGTALLMTLLLLARLLGKGGFRRADGLILLIIYAVYIALSVARFS